jgi:hypothetical protein
MLSLTLVVAAIWYAVWCNKNAPVSRNHSCSSSTMHRTVLVPLWATGLVAGILTRAVTGRFWLVALAVVVGAIIGGMFGGHMMDRKFRAIPSRQVQAGQLADIWLKALRFWNSDKPVLIRLGVWDYGAIDDAIETVKQAGWAVEKVAICQPDWQFARVQTAIQFTRTEATPAAEKPGMAEIMSLMPTL